VKLDTVGVGLIGGADVAAVRLMDLELMVDNLGIPLDGWSNGSVSLFRKGRRELYRLTVRLLEAMDAIVARPKVVINTVAHRGNIEHFDRIFREIARHRSVCCWNVFQYTQTDQASRNANSRFAVGDVRFDRCAADFLDGYGARKAHFPVEFRSTRSRLGQYLLINSDGEAWFPDERGSTVTLGSAFGREKHVLDDWSAKAGALVRRDDHASEAFATAATSISL
jgi:MoaA/NifB/PqqE/SkfB family radical SAM enzyme